jgi:hypothetical protein
MLFIIGGPDTKNLNSSRFQAYDYGSSDKNQLHYNQTTAPIYSIRSMKVPTAVFWADEDWLADPEDVTYVFDNIQSLGYEKYIPDYDHFDFVWVKTANKIIYEDLINIMQNYHPVQ